MIRVKHLAQGSTCGMCSETSSHCDGNYVDAEAFHGGHTAKRSNIFEHFFRLCNVLSPSCSLFNVILPSL